MAKNNKYDVIIAGGGVIGMAIAYYLSCTKKLSIAVVDKKKPGAASWASAGGLWALGESVGLGCGVIFFHSIVERVKMQQSQDDSTLMPHVLPEHFFKYSLLSYDYFPQLARDLIGKTGVDFHYDKSGLLFVIQDEYDMKYANIILDYIHTDYESHYEMIDKIELKQREPFVTDKALAGMFFHSDHQVNPYMLVSSFAAGAAMNGVTIFADDEVTGVDVNNDTVTSITTPRSGELFCGTLINAAGAWANDIGKMVGINLPITPIKGQILLSEKLPVILNAGLTTNDCYICQKNNGEILIGSTTEDVGFDVSGGFEKLQDLAKGATKALPVLENLFIKRSWAGLRPGTPDEGPILGAVDGLNGYLNACGHFRTGIVNAPATGIIIRDLILGNSLPIDIEPFLYKRFQEGNDMD